MQQCEIFSRAPCGLTGPEGGNQNSLWFVVGGWFWSEIEIKWRATVRSVMMSSSTLDSPQTQHTRSPDEKDGNIRRNQTCDASLLRFRDFVVEISFILIKIREFSSSPCFGKEGCVLWEGSSCLSLNGCVCPHGRQMAALVTGWVEPTPSTSLSSCPLFLSSPSLQACT